MTTIETETIGQTWLETARHILRDGADAVYDGEPTKELPLVAIHVAAPDPDDAARCPIGPLVVHAKSAHVHEPELVLMAELSA